MTHNEIEYFKQLKTEFSDRIDDFQNDEITREILLSEIVTTAKSLYKFGIDKRAK